MKTQFAEKFIVELLNSAGITVQGNQPWDIQVHNPLFFSRILQNSALGLGESYMDGWWDCQAIDQFFYRILRTNLNEEIKKNKLTALNYLIAKIVNFQTTARSFTVGRKHYDIGDHLFKYMLDPRMNYTCAYWQDATTLEQAQINKLELTCQKLWLKPGMRLLDIGCGWGGLAKYAAENFGVEVVGVTISKKQYEYATQLCKGLPVEIRFQDYRNVQEKFDRVVSLGMFEHVGHLNYRTYMQVVKNCLNDEGIFLLHTIGNNLTEYQTNAWTEKYIFPNGMLPSVAQIGKAIEKLFVMEDWHNFGVHYDKTLMAWHANFNRHWEDLKQDYDSRFFRMWNYYLLSSAGAFRARNIQLWQVVLSKNGIKGGYQVTRPYFQVASESQHSAKNLQSAPL